MNSKWIVVSLVALFQLGASASGVDCYESAQSKLGQNRAIELCAAATDRSPYDCFISAKSSHLTENQALTLCSSTPSAMGPLVCYLRGMDNHLGQNRSIQLCRFSGNGNAMQCFESVRDTLGENFAIELCIQSPSIETSECFYKSRAAHLTTNQALSLCQARRFK